MSVAPFRWRDLYTGWDRFFFTPRNTAICGVLRIAYSVLLLINVLILLPDLERWFGETGVLPYDASRAIIDPDTLTLFAWLPRTHQALQLCYGLLVTHIVLLLAGFFSRIQALCVFIWLVSFQHRHLILFDAEDVVFRLLGFFLIFLPIGDWYSVDRYLRKRRGQAPPPSERPLWALRLIQIQLTLIYLSTVWEKMRGTDWVTGRSLYYVSRLDDLFGHFPVPAFLFNSLSIVRVMSWSVLALEVCIPIALWFKETRRITLVIAILFHLSIEYMMNLFLFHWVMIVALLSFSEPEDYVALRNLAARLWAVMYRVVSTLKPRLG